MDFSTGVIMSGEDFDSICDVDLSKQNTFKLSGRHCVKTQQHGTYFPGPNVLPRHGSRKVTTPEV